MYQEGFGSAEKFSRSITNVDLKTVSLIFLTSDHRVERFSKTKIISNQYLEIHATYFHNNKL